MHKSLKLHMARWIIKQRIEWSSPEIHRTLYEEAISTVFLHNARKVNENRLKPVVSHHTHWFLTPERNPPLSQTLLMQKLIKGFTLPLFCIHRLYLPLKNLDRKYGQTKVDRYRHTLFGKQFQ